MVSTFPTLVYGQRPATSGRYYRYDKTQSYLTTSLSLVWGPESDQPKDTGVLD